MTFTSASILKQRQIFNICSNMKSSSYIEKLKCGNKCDKLLTDAKLMRNLLKTIEYFIPSGEIVGGTQAYMLYTIQFANVSGDGNATIVIEGTTEVIYSFDFLAQASAAAFVVLIIAYINEFNTMYPDNYPYVAVAHPTNSARFFLTSNLYDESNGIVCDLTFTPDVGVPSVLSGVFANGTEPVYRLESENCLTNGEVEIILNKISTLCATPCEDIVNFE